MMLWLVEVMLKDWRPNLPDGTRVLDYVEVLADSELGARYRAADQYDRRAKYEPALRLKLSRLGLSTTDYYIGQAVALGDAHG